MRESKIQGLPMYLTLKITSDAIAVLLKILLIIVTTDAITPLLKIY